MPERRREAAIVSALRSGCPLLTQTTAQKDSVRDPLLEKRLVRVGSEKSARARRSLGGGEEDGRTGEKRFVSKRVERENGQSSKSQRLAQTASRPRKSTHEIFEHKGFR